MSDGEEPTSPVVAEADEVEVSGDAASKGATCCYLRYSVRLKESRLLPIRHFNPLTSYYREASKALDRRQAHVCILNEACEEEAYKKLVVALCSEHKIPLIKVPDGKQLGEWAGLCVLDREGNARKVVNCSCVVVKDWGEESQERSILLNYFQTEQ
ncbi:L30e-like protein [Hyaloscypha bicolor E]|uniref:40S ribosomal protein S12 n=1 Tax=Hyaloscypha bicolor E TaxID=1095630 RepID=A0A2J6TPI5_9HELO|nr:L30e-like protein [Hyaloscypha bicolor E]PMD64926.1 L30e-like protein [Hyaloscypha bicolor E]